MGCNYSLASRTNDRLVQSMLKLGHGYVIASHIKLWMQFLISMGPKQLGSINAADKDQISCKVDNVAAYGLATQ